MSGSLELVPLLQIQRQLYDIPLGRERFERYLAVMTGGGADLELPLSLFNPMAKPQAEEALDRLIEVDVEGAARAAVDEAGRRLPVGEERLRVGLVLVDDRGGGWTNRHLTEIKARLSSGAELRRGWVTALLWTSDSPSPDDVAREVMATVYRARHVLAHGQPEVLGEILLQEGRAAAFAGGSCRLDGESLAVCREVIDPHRSSSHFPTVFCCLYGDEVARSVGYEPLGLPPRAGYELALDEALGGGGRPESALVS